MEYYNTLRDGSLRNIIGLSIPVGHKLYQKALEDVELGNAIIYDYTETTQTPLEIRDSSLTSITWIRPSDSVEIQIRHPDYASDYLVMESIRDSLGEGESNPWIDIDDNAITMSKQDMTDCLEHGITEINRIVSEYILTL